MQLLERARGSISELRQGLLVFLRRIFHASRLLDALTYAFGCMLVMCPVALVGLVLNWTLANGSTWVAVSVVMIAAMLLLLFAALMTNHQFLKDIHLQGIKWPSLLSVALAWFAVVVFGGMSCGFERAGIVEIQPSVPIGEGCATRYADLYLWHLFEAIPGIKFNETVGWERPYSYSDNLSGWLLVAFKILVIVSVIGSFVVSGRLRRESAAARDVSSQSANKGDA
jgi:hypothetical protein